jgi:hypothetical protein
VSAREHLPASFVDIHDRGCANSRALPAIDSQHNSVVPCRDARGPSITRPPTYSPVSVFCAAGPFAGIPPASWPTASPPDPAPPASSPARRIDPPSPSSASPALLHLVCHKVQPLIFARVLELGAHAAVHSRSLNDLSGSKRLYQMQIVRELHLRSHR